MENMDSKREINTWKVIAIVLLIAFLATGIYGTVLYREKQHYRTFLQNQYQRAFRDLVMDVENTKVLLDKLQVTASAIQSNILTTQLWQNSYSAAQNLGLLPITQGVLEKTEKFLNQLSDFSLSISKQTASNRLMTEDQDKQLKKLTDLSSNLAKELKTMQQDINQDKIQFGEIASKGKFYLRKTPENIVDTKFGSIEKQFTDYPSMIYDGPFSDNIIESKSKSLERERTVDIKTAEESVKRFLGKEKVGKIVEISAGKGKIDTFGLEVIPADSDKKSIFMDITKKGGHVLWMIDPRIVAEKKLTDEEASKKAKQFLKEQGFGELVETFHYKNDNTITVTFIGLEENGALVYPDQMKVKVALDNGDIVGFDAYQFLMAHRERDIGEPVLSQDEAREKVSKNLNINRTKLALIPMPGDKEVLCYEFKGENNKNDYFVYINAKDGNEENILRIIKEENGVLTQ